MYQFRLGCNKIKNWGYFSSKIEPRGGRMIKIHLSRLLGEKRWSQAQLSRLTGIRPNTISDLYNEFTERISLDQLNQICKILECDIADLLEYIPDNQDPRKWAARRRLKGILFLFKRLFCSLCEKILHFTRKATAGL